MSDEQGSLDYAFRYFDLHAQQRMTVFNFFLFLSGALAGGIGASLTGDEPFALSGLFLSSLLMLLSLVFYKLDRRTSFLIKHAESALIKSEKVVIRKGSRLVGSEEEAFKAWQGTKNFFTRGWSYSLCFLVVFCGTAIVGLIGLFYSSNILCNACMTT